MFRRFDLAGLGRPAYVDYVASGLGYPAWATRYNARTESLALEITKWILSGTAALVLTSSLLTMDEEDSVASRIGISMPLILSSGGLWALDLSNVGDAPDELPEL